MMDNDKAQRAACPRCGTPSSPRGHGYTSAGYTCPPVDVVAALREELARVTAERDALAVRLKRVTAEVRDWQHGEDCEARGHEDECGWADPAHTAWECCGETSTMEECQAMEAAECDCGVARLRAMLRGDL